MALARTLHLPPPPSRCAAGWLLPMLAWLAPAIAAGAGVALPVSEPALPVSGPALAPRPALDMHSVTLGEDFFASGVRVQTPSTVRGDALLAARLVTADGSVGGDLVVSGARLTIAGHVARTLYAAGAQVHLDGDIGGNARIAAGQVLIGRGAHIAGGATLAARSVDFQGTAGSYLVVIADHASLDGHVPGDLIVIARVLDVGPHALIDGALHVSGAASVRVAAGARLSGAVQRFNPVPAARYGSGYGALVRSLWWLLLLGWLLVGAVALGLWPQFTVSVSTAARTRTGVSLLVGLLVLIATPFLAALLLLSILGVPLGLWLLLLYLLLLPLGYLSGATSLGDWLLERLRAASLPLQSHVWRLLMLTVILIVLRLLTHIPILGRVLQLLVLLLGIGALVLALSSRLRAPPTAAELLAANVVLSGPK